MEHGVNATLNSVCNQGACELEVDPGEPDISCEEASDCQLIKRLAAPGASPPMSAKRSRNASSRACRARATPNTGPVPSSRLPVKTKSAGCRCCSLSACRSLIACRFLEARESEGHKVVVEGRQHVAMPPQRLQRNGWVLRGVEFGCTV